MRQVSVAGTGMTRFGKRSSSIKALAVGASRQAITHAGRQAYEQSGLGPDDMDVVEVHDCFSMTEILSNANFVTCHLLTKETAL